MSNVRDYPAGNETWESPARSGVGITPNDNADLASITRAIWVGTGGNLRVKLLDDAAPVTLVGVPSGSILPLMAVRVYSTSTTATDLVGLS